MMTSLVFRSLDRQVIAGNADLLAIDTDSVKLTYAQLLAQTAALSGGLVNVGVQEGSRVSLDLRGADLIGAVLALARIGAIPDSHADFEIEGDPPVVHTGEHDYAWATVLSAGKNDPLAAPDTDPPDYGTLLKSMYEDIFATLTSGGTLH